MFHVILVVTDTGGPHQSISNLYTCLTCASNIQHGLGKPLLKEHKMITRAEQWVSSHVAG